MKQYYAMTMLTNLKYTVLTLSLTGLLFHYTNSHAEVSGMVQTGTKNTTSNQRGLSTPEHACAVIVKACKAVNGEEDKKLECIMQIMDGKTVQGVTTVQQDDITRCQQRFSPGVRACFTIGIACGKAGNGEKDKMRQCVTQIVDEKTVTGVATQQDDVTKCKAYLNEWKEKHPNIQRK